MGTLLEKSTRLRQFIPRLKCHGPVLAACALGNILRHMGPPDDTEWTRRLGTVALDETGDVVAGSVGQWTFRYRVGAYGIDEGGTIKMAHRYASDWEIPQFDRPCEAGYTTVTTGGRAKLRVRYDRKGHIRPWMKCMVIDVYDGSLGPGDVVTIVLGDRREGSPGMRAQTFVEAEHEFRFWVDPTNACLVRRLATSPVVRVVPGKPKRLVCIVPTQGRVDQPVKIFAGWRDAFGNPCADGAEIELRWEGNAPARIEGSALIVTSAGSGRIRASAGDMSTSSNSLTVFDNLPRYNKYWGDLHAQSGSTIGSGTERAYFEYAHDAARLDFTSHQGNDFQVSDETWAELNRLTAEFNQEHQFVVFPGYEWSANTPAGGDRNVFYLEEGLPIIRSSHWQIGDAETDLSPAHPADELFRKMRAGVPLEKVVLGSHVGGRYADIRAYFDGELGPLVELCSCWGVFEWMLGDALEQGYVVGVMCNSDGHKGRPGAEGPGAGEFGIAGGLTCVLAAELTRAVIFEALKQRRCYGTTGARIDLDFTVNGRAMGSVLRGDGGLDIRACAKCPGAIESLSLFENMKCVQTVRACAFEDVADSKRLRISWGGAKMRGRGRRVKWDGRIKVEGAAILKAETFAFDSPADGIRDVGRHEISFASQTTGDIDGIDVWLDDWSGRVVFESEVGRVEQQLETLTPRQRHDLGGLGMHVSFERYPECLADMELRLQTRVTPSLTVLRSTGGGNKRAYWVKVVQEDGQMAWASPIYVGQWPDRSAGGKDTRYFVRGFNPMRGFQA